MKKTLRYNRIESIDVSIDAWDVVRWLYDTKQIPGDFRLDDTENYIEWPLKMTFKCVMPADDIPAPPVVAPKGDE